jgi:hypothetical protein
MNWRLARVFPAQLHSANISEVLTLNTDFSVYNQSRLSASKPGEELERD